MTLVRRYLRWTPECPEFLPVDLLPDSPIANQLAEMPAFPSAALFVPGTDGDLAKGDRYAWEPAEPTT
jgi:hypothetical protein